MNSLYFVIDKTLNSVPTGVSGYWVELLLVVREPQFPAKLRGLDVSGLPQRELSDACGRLLFRAVKEFAKERYEYDLWPQVNAVAELRGEERFGSEWGQVNGRIPTDAQRSIEKEPVHFVSSDGVEVWMLNEKPKADLERGKLALGVE